MVEHEFHDCQVDNCASKSDRAAFNPHMTAAPFTERRLGTPSRERALRRDVGLTGLMFVSVGSIIGSRWLFGALYASQQAGPAALLSWGIGAVFMLTLALIH